LYQSRAGSPGTGVPRAPPWQTPRVTLRSGDVLGRYQVLCPIGAGGMAEVYAARVLGVESFAKLVALKVMLPHLSRDPKFVRMFVEEARLAGNIESAHVVATLDLGRDEHEGLYQVMELVLGASLRQLLDASESPLPRLAALNILAELARGLADAHAARGDGGAPLGLVHRDVSPHNVLVGVDGRTRLSDFGVARAAASAAATESGELKGKLAYSAPEQLRGEVADARSDVFALGVVCWEVLAGARLFTAENPLALVDMMVRRPIPRLDQVRPGLDGRLADLCESMLVRERSARTITAAAAAGRLEQLARESRGSAAREVIGALVRERAGEPLAELEQTIRARAQELAVAPPPASAPPPAPAPPPARTVPGRPRLPAAAAALLALALGAAAWRALSVEPPESRDARRVDPDARGAEDAGLSIDASAPTDAPPDAPFDSDAARVTSALLPDLRGAREATPRGAREERGAIERSPAADAVEEAAEERANSPVMLPSTRAPDAAGLLGIEDFDRSGEHER
jgi:serine/threonine-protein kinase